MTSLQQAREASRDDIESDLVFAGFLVFYCPLKPDAIQAVTMLNESSHRVVMITGDNALTACHVAKEVGIVENEALVADVWEDGGEKEHFFRLECTYVKPCAQHLHGARLMKRLLLRRI